MTKKIADKIFDSLLVLFIFLLPWQTRFIYKDIMLDGQLWQYGRLSLYASMLVLILAAIFFGLPRREQWHLSQHKWWYILFIYGLLFCLARPWPILGLYYFFIIFGTLLFIFLARHLSQAKILWAIWASALGQGLVAIYQSLYQSISANKWLGISQQVVEYSGTSVLADGSLRILRAYGFLPHPNILAGFLTLGILVSLYLWHDVYVQSEKVDWQIKKIKRYTSSLCLIIFSLVLMTFAQLATFSRSALLALLCCLLFILIFSVIKKDKLTFYVVIKYFIIMLLVAWAFNMYYPNLWASRFDLGNRLEAKSIQDRQITYSQLDWGNPRVIIFGQGLGLNTYQAYQKNRPASLDQVQPIHNWFLLALAEIGLTGVLIFLALLYLYFKKILWKKNNYQVWNIAFVLLLIFLGLFDHYLWTSWTGWLMVGVVVAIIYHNKD